MEAISRVTFFAPTIIGSFAIGAISILMTTVTQVLIIRRQPHSVAFVNIWKLKQYERDHWFLLKPCIHQGSKQMYKET